MSGSTAGLRRKINSALELQSVVRCMKALAASSIGQYEQSVRSLGDYYQTVELGLGACFRQSAGPSGPERAPVSRQMIGAVVFGSDQGLVGPFNDVVVSHALQTLATLPGKPEVWAVGERVHARLADAGLTPVALLGVPTSVDAIAPLVAQIQVETETRRSQDQYSHVYVFHNRPTSRARYEPIAQRLLPLDAEWQRSLTAVPWPTRNLPEVFSGGTATLRELIREYLFISLFRACAESLASENASRLSAMERADRNIDELLQTLHGAFHRLRQRSIDEELFDVVSGYDATFGAQSDSALRR